MVNGTVNINNMLLLSIQGIYLGAKIVKGGFRQERNHYLSVAEETGVFFGSLLHYIVDFNIDWSEM